MEHGHYRYHEKTLIAMNSHRSHVGAAVHRENEEAYTPNEEDMNDGNSVAVAVVVDYTLGLDDAAFVQHWDDNVVPLVVHQNCMGQ